MKPFPKGLYVPYPKTGYKSINETWRLTADGPDVEIDRRPKVIAAAGGDAALDVEIVAATGFEYRLDQPEVTGVLNEQDLYLTFFHLKYSVALLTVLSVQPGPRLSSENC